MQSDSVAVKSHLRLTSQRLGQIQAKNDSQANITRTDITTLIQRNNVPLAREKAEKLIMDEAYGDLLEEIGMQLGILLEKFHELERNISPSPVMIEAASTIIYATPYVHSKDLDAVRKYLIERVGPDFARSAAGNRDHHVSTRVLKFISAPIPSAFQLDSYLQEIAQTYGISWSPDPAPQYIINSLSEILDLETNPEVDLSELRRLCLRGIPDEPAWLRPRIWKLFFGIISTKKPAWKAESTKQRDAYYDLVRQLLEPLPNLPTDHSPLDDTLLAVYKQLSGLPRNIFSLLEDEPDASNPCPLHENAPDSMKISYSRELESRLKVLLDRANETSHINPTPEIRLESDFNTTPGISLTNFDSNIVEDNSSTTLLPSRRCLFGNAHPQHCSSLLRLLYLHNAINPGSPSYHTASVLVPLYSALNQEVEVDDVAHVEADAFWLLEAVLAEFSGLEEDDGNVWMKAFSERLAWADFEFSADLETRSLDPSLPHYSYRWLMPMLTHTLPLPSLFKTWDALFSCPPRERGSYPKLEYLVNICTSMLLRSKNHLLRLGNVGRTTRSLWNTEVGTQSPGTPQDSFMEVLSFLQNYNPQYVGGIERVLQTASELAQRREQESAAAQQPTLSLGARLKVNMWRGFTAQNSTSGITANNNRRDKDYIDSDETETSSTAYQTNLASRVTGSVWRGITNRTAMEDDSPPTPPSPAPPVPPKSSNVDNGQNQAGTQPQASSSIWGYAEKLKDSDAVATLSKVSTNWRVKGILGSWGTNKPNSPITPNGSEKEVSPPIQSNQHERRGSLPFLDSPRLFSPPAAFASPEATFKSPTDNPLPGNSGLIEKTKSLISLTRSPPPTTPKSAPRPLFLNSSTLITTGQRDSFSRPPHSASAGATTPDTDEWAEVMNAKRHHFHRDSQSSISSLSPSDAFGRIPKSALSERDSDVSSSRIVSLNRRSVSPMAPNFRVGHIRPSSRNSSASSGLNSPPLLAKSPLQESSLMGEQALAIDSVAHVIAPQPVTLLSNNLNHDGEESDSSDATSSELPVPTRKPSWKKAGDNTMDSEDTANSGTVSIPSRTPRVRSKRYPRPANLQIQDDKKPRSSAEQKTPSPSTLKVEWPGDDYENIATPKASSFDSDESPGIPKSPRRSRKLSSGDIERPRKMSTDTYREERPRKISSGRSRKVSTEGREVPRARRESAAEEGDDEGYDELLSAYESEDVPTASLR